MSLQLPIDGMDTYGIIEEGKSVWSMLGGEESQAKGVKTA